eukprot:6584850-Prymnesium_polylepis.1
MASLSRVHKGFASVGQRQTVVRAPRQGGRDEAPLLAVRIDELQDLVVLLRRPARHAVLRLVGALRRRHYFARVATEPDTRFCPAVAPTAVSP